MVPHVVPVKLSSVIGQSQCQRSPKCACECDLTGDTLTGASRKCEILSKVADWSGEISKGKLCVGQMKVFPGPTYTHLIRHDEMHVQLAGYDEKCLWCDVTLANPCDHRFLQVRDHSVEPVLRGLIRR